MAAADGDAQSDRRLLGEGELEPGAQAHLARDGQAQAGAARVAMARAVGAKGALAQAQEIRLVDAGPVVDDGDLEAAACLGAQEYGHVPARPTMDDRVLDHVGHRLLGGDGIAGRHQRALRGGDVDGDALLAGEKADPVGGALDGVHQRGTRPGGRPPALAELAGQPEVAGQPAQVDHVMDGAGQERVQLGGSSFSRPGQSVKTDMMLLANEY
jgi:hypothetical protein